MNYKVLGRKVDFHLKDKIWPNSTTREK